MTLESRLPDQERVLVLSSTICGDRPQICRILRQAGLTCECVTDPARLQAEIQRGAGALVVEQGILSPQVLKSLTAILHEQPIWSNLPLIVAQMPEQGPLPSLAGLGGILLLEHPIRQRELASMVQAALQMRRRQYQVRDQLAEHSRTEEQLRRSEQAYRRLFDNRLNGMARGRVILDVGGLPTDIELLEINETFEQMAGTAHQDVIGRPLREIFPDLQSECLAPIEACGRTALSGREEQVEFFQEHLQRWYSVYVYSPRQNEFIAIMSDISERKQAELQLKQWGETLERRVAERTAEVEYRAAQLRRLAEELVQAEEWERRRLAQVLHDHLQQLLVGARFSLGLLRRRLGDDDARQVAQQVDDLLHQSISMSRSLTAELSPPVLYDAGLAQALNWLAGWMHDRHSLDVQVQADPAANPPEKVRILLFQAVRELLFNVVKHAGTSRARILMHEQDGQVRILVEDDGAGFDPAQVEARQRGRGGFGLFSIRQRLEWLGGSVRIDSTPGRGTRTELLAPLRMPEGEKRDLVEEAPLAQVLRQAASAPAPQKPPRGPEPIRVILADDHAVVRDGLAQLLETEPDIEVVGQAADGRQAVDLAVQLHPDVVLMDVSMPGINGIEATRQIKSHLPQTRVIGLSMHARAGMAAAMRQAGACDYLTKTAGPDDLVRTIRAGT